MMLRMTNKSLRDAVAEHLITGAPLAMHTWDTSGVTNMSFLFFGCTFPVGQDISGWDVSNVVSMESMFEECSSFNNDISSWNVSNVRSMNQMFASCYDFTVDVSNWNVDNVEDARDLFFRTENFSNLRFSSTCKK